jgi:YegS/Rv2252/BmrU family lipid kinase
MIVNPTAGRRRRRRLEQIITKLRGLGCMVTRRDTTARGDAERQAAGADPEHFDVLAVAGGDGTINEVLNGIPAKAPPLAIVPLGTANVLAAEIGLGRSAVAIAETIATGSPRSISLGEANGRRFAVMASVGLDAEVVDKVSLRLKRYLGIGAYLIETFHQLVTFQPAAYRLRIDGVDHRAHGAIVANGHFYGGRFVAAPGADIETASLDVCRCTRKGRLAAIQYLASLVSGQLAARADYHISTATSIEITGPAGASLQADGDVLTRLPATITILPGAVDLIFPPPKV